MRKIQKNPRLRSLSILLFASLVTLGVSWSYAEIVDISGTFGNPYSFSPSFDRGNAGSIIFSGLTLNTDIPETPTLNGEWLFLETVGWAQLENQTTNLTNADISIPIEVGSGVSSWPLKAPVYAWSNNAGWLTLHSLDVNTYSGVSYIPGSQSFTGFAWSDTLGYIDFSAANTIFKNKVKILGNIGGNKAFDTEYNVGNKFNSVSVTSLLDTVRKNIALMTRGIADSDSRINKTGTSTPTILNSDAIFYKITGNAPLNIDIGTLMDNKNTRTVIVEGSDVYINGDISKDTQVNKSRAVIVMKDENGKGGNVYIAGSVKNIYTSLIAEGSIYSGDSTGLYNEVATKVTHLPRSQLYILGSVISRNTIGGASLFPTPSCPYIEGSCTFENSIRYDWNYFRTYDKTKQSLHGSDNHSWEDYSVIIEHDSRVIIDPPPGLAN